MEILITISIDTDERKLYIGQENTSANMTFIKTAIFQML